MSPSLYDHGLLLLIDATPYGLHPETPAMEVALRQLARRGLLHADILGRHTLTPLGLALMRGNIGPFKATRRRARQYQEKGSPGRVA